MNHKFVRGQALVIAGPQGSGKTTLAREIARENGTFKEIDGSVLESPFGLASIGEMPDTLIVEELPRLSPERLKALLTDERVRIDRKFAQPIMAKTPNFIFCTGEKDCIKFENHARRFRVIRLKAAHA